MRDLGGPFRLREGVAQRPIGALTNHHLLVVFLDLAQRVQHPREHQHQHHYSGKGHVEALQGQIDATGDDNGENRFLDCAEHGFAEHLALQGTVQVVRLATQHLVRQVLSPHRLERLYRLQRVGKAGEQRYQKLCLSAPCLLGHL